MFNFFDVLFVLSMRFFLFDFYLFNNIRSKIDNLNYYIPSKLLKCSFCQGFWVGFLYSLFIYGWSYFWISFHFGFGMAILSFTWYVCTDPLILENERRNHGSLRGSSRTGIK